MILNLIRFRSDSHRTFGRLYVDSKFECWVLEDAFHDVKIAGETRIPAGVYELALRHSPHFTPKYGHNMIWVKDVPGYEYILLHKGNTEADTRGCLLVGSSIETERLLGSGTAYDKLYPKVSEAIKKRDFDKSEPKVSLVVLDYDRAPR